LCESEPGNTKNLQNHKTSFSDIEN
jgi:hypothetical protein